MSEGRMRYLPWLLVWAGLATGCPTPPRPAGGEVARPSTTVEVGRGAALAGEDGFSEIYLTVMPDDLALVRERREASLPDGVTSIAYLDVVDTLVPESTRVRFRPDGGDPEDVEFLEQRYRYDLIQPARLLELSLGQTVHVRWTQPRNGTDRVMDGVIESTEAGLFLRTPDGTFTIGSPPGDADQLRTVLDALPGALFARPQLDWIVATADGGDGVLETSYLAHGFSWEADYVLTASEDFTQADLLAWVTLRNQTAARFDRAHLAVVAGKINVAADQRTRAFDSFADVNGAPYDDEQTGGYVEEGLFEYHLYKLERPTDLPAYSWKQVQFLERSAIPITTKYRANVTLPDANYGGYTGTDDFTPAPVRRVITVENKLDVDGLGVPLPAGTARVYARSGEDLYFIDSTAVENTPREEPLELEAGGAPFLVVKSKLTDTREAEAGSFGSYTVTSHLVTMVNRGSRTVTLVLRLSMPGANYPNGGDWDVRLERRGRAEGPAIEEISSGVWEIEHELAPDVETTEELVVRVRRAY